MVAKDTKYVDIVHLCRGMLSHEHLDIEADAYYETVANMLNVNPWQ